MSSPSNIGPYPSTHIPVPFGALLGPPDQTAVNPFSMGMDDILPGYPQGSFNAEFLDAAGGLMIQNFFDGSDDRSQNPSSSYMPG